MLKLRIITALVLVAIVLSALFGLGREWFALVAAAFFLAAAWEWSAWIGRLSVGGRSVWLVLVAGIMWAVETWQLAAWLQWAPLFWLFALVLVVRYPQGTGLWSSVAAMSILGFLVIVPAWAAVVHIKDHGALGLDGPWALLFVLLWVWAADTGAYFAGRRFGKHKLAPSVSPGKTIEGLVGGVLLSLAVVVAVHQLAPIAIDAPLILLLPVALVTVLASVLGDLFESMVKRFRGVKDSGNVLPGHGGMLDRVDSVTAALPVAVALLSWAQLPGGF